MKVADQIGIALLAVVMLSCTSQRPTPPVAIANTTPAKPALPKDENGVELPMPELVRSKKVSIEGSGVKTVTVGNANGDYNLFCNTKASNCLTPVPARDYYVFNDNTKWKMPGAKDYITLKWIQDRAVKYNQSESIALFPVEGGAPEEMGRVRFIVLASSRTNEVRYTATHGYQTDSH
jgi:hypothetical protein